MQRAKEIPITSGRCQQSVRDTLLLKQKPPNVISNTPGSFHARVLATLYDRFFTNRHVYRISSGSAVRVPDKYSGVYGFESQVSPGYIIHKTLYFPDG